MIKTVIRIEGMMCPHCEARVTEAIKTATGAEDVTSSHEKGETVVLSSSPLDEGRVKDAVTSAGYKFIGMETE